MKKIAKKNNAFSLIEVVIAALLLSMVVITVCTLSTRSLTAVKINRDYEFAWEILDRQLTTIEAIGIEEFIEAGQFSGQLGDEGSERGIHYWQVQVQEEEPDNLYHVDVTISWAHGSVSAATALNGKGLLSIDDTSGEGG